MEREDARVQTNRQRDLLCMGLFEHGPVQPVGNNERQKERERERQRQTDKQTDRQTNRKRGRERDRENERARE